PPRRRCSFVALPFVGHAHATGEVLGLGIALGADLAHELRRALLQLFGFDRLDGPRIDRIRVPDLGLTLPLAPPDGRWALEPGRWIGPARRWASALPVVLDWFPKRDRGFEEIVRQGIVVAGYPEPAAIELRPASAVPGAPFLRRHDRKRRAAEPVRPWAHLVVEFGVDLTGPVLLGHMRHLGLGLCAPLPNGDE
ncbi:MAG TPA: type I-U CRISPR-associated protein Csb2, partial [Candidatus Limnocylindrales bacterium]|nr:type I-U CRISPR-associated protein Csb2 [Candidatus Limnocylindrales bacterium]